MSRALRRVIPIIIVLAPACGDGSVTFDAPRADAPAPDAQVDATTTEGDHRYIADTVQVPTTTTEVQTFGMNIDGDEPNGDTGIDNQLGAVLAALGNLGGSPATATTTAVDRGDILELFDFQTTSFTDASGSTLTVYLGDNPNPAPCTGPGDTVCRRHLTGTGSFTLDAASPTDATVTGAVVSNVFTSVTSPDTLPLVIALSPGAPLRLDLIGAKVELRGASATGITDIKIAGAVPAADVDGVVIPAIQVLLMEAVTADCPTAVPPTCTCVPGSTGEQTLSMFDADDDCVVTVLEVRENPVVSGFFMPDVTLGGVDALSLGVKLSAVGATFTPP